MADKVPIGGGLSIAADELHFEFTCASGPGGQHVNRTETAVQLRFDAARSPSLPPEVRRRLIVLAGRRATSEGVIVIRAQRFKSQERNRRDAVDRLAELVRRAAAPPRPRRPTRPTAASRRRRLQSKIHRGRIKRLRSTPGAED